MKVDNLSYDTSDAELKGVFEQYFRYCKPSYETWVEPSKRFADVIIPNAGTGVNFVAIDVLCKHIAAQLAIRQTP